MDPDHDYNHDYAKVALGSKVPRLAQIEGRVGAKTGFDYDHGFDFDHEAEIRIRIMTIIITDCEYRNQESNSMRETETGVIGVSNVRETPPPSA